MTPGRTASMTADALWHLPDDGHIHELVGGHLVRDSPAGGRHGLLALDLGGRLWSWARERRAGVVLAAETGFHLRTDPDTVRAPDVAFVAREHIPAGGVPEGFWVGPPDLAVEVLSPDDRRVDVLEKVGDYLDAGVIQVWIVDPGTRTLTVYRSLQDVRVLADDDTLVGDGPVEGFHCHLRDLFG